MGAQAAALHPRALTVIVLKPFAGAVESEVMVRNYQSVMAQGLLSVWA